MGKTNINTVLVIFFIATAVLVIGVLAVISLTTTAMAAKPDFGYCAQGSQLKVCSATIEGCEAGRELARIQGHCHPSPIRQD